MTDLTLIVVRDQATELIREEVRASKARARLEQAVIEAVEKLRCTVDEVSAASGLTPAEIASILERPALVDADLAALAGVC